MKKVQEAIDAGIITYSDIEAYIESLQSTIITIEYLDRLEEIAKNHPG